MEFFKKTALAALVMGFSGAALALPNITILATGMENAYFVINLGPANAGLIFS